MPVPTAVACPTCGTMLRSVDMSLETMSARCPGCQALVDLRGVVPNPDHAPRTSSIVDPVGGADALPVPLPAGIRVEDRGRDLVIVRRWFSWVYIFLVFFCVVWDGMLVFWYSLAFLGEAPLVFKLFPLLHVAAGAFITYLTIAGFVNRTTFTVERDRLTVRHGPLPWRGNVDISTTSLEQLFCTEQVIRGRNGISLRYGVDAVLKDGRHLKLATALDVREQALYIEQAIEKHLGIVDRRVRSEMAR